MPQASRSDPLGRIVDSQWRGLDRRRWVSAGTCGDPYSSATGLKLNDLYAWEITKRCGAGARACCVKRTILPQELGLTRAMGAARCETLNVYGGDHCARPPGGRLGARIVLQSAALC